MASLISRHERQLRGKYGAEHPMRRAAKPRLSRKRNPTARKRLMSLYASAQWREMRLRILSASPICSLCKFPANELDHIKRHHGDPKLFFDERNLQPLCSNCHKKKTLHEQRMSRDVSPGVTRLA